MSMITCANVCCMYSYVVYRHVCTALVRCTMYCTRCTHIAVHSTSTMYMVDDMYDVHRTTYRYYVCMYLYRYSSSTLYFVWFSTQSHTGRVRCRTIATLLCVELALALLYIYTYAVRCTMYIAHRTRRMQGYHRAYHKARYTNMQYDVLCVYSQVRDARAPRARHVHTHIYRHTCILLR